MSKINIDDNWGDIEINWHEDHGIDFNPNSHEENTIKNLVSNIIRVHENGLSSDGTGECVLENTKTIVSKANSFKNDHVGRFRYFKKLSKFKLDLEITTEPYRGASGRANPSKIFKAIALAIEEKNGNAIISKSIEEIGDDFPDK